MQEIRLLKTGCSNYSRKEVEIISEVMKQGGLLVFPTETVYGIGADARSDVSCRRIYEAKGRESDNPLIVHVDSMETMSRFAHTEEVEMMPELEKLWPGPLTVIMRKKEGICDTATAGLNTVGMRIPDCNLIREAIKVSGVPLAAPSANISGRPSATRASHILKELGPLVDLVIDGEEATYGIESTVILPEGRKCTILRPGAYTREDLLKIFDQVEFGGSEGRPLSPGTKYSHYTPEKTLYRSDRDAIKKYMEKNHGKVLPIVTKETADILGIECMVLGHSDKPMEISHNLYHCLRQLDKSPYDHGIIETFPHIGYFISIMNRIERASVKLEE